MVNKISSDVDPIGPNRSNELTITTRPNIDYEKILVYVGIISFLITFWQGWRDIHKDMADIKERTARIEEKLWPKP